MVAGPCPYCRSHLPDGSRHCPACGGPIAPDGDDKDETNAEGPPDRAYSLEEARLAEGCLVGCTTDLVGNLAALLASFTFLALVPEAYF